MSRAADSRAFVMPPRWRVAWAGEGQHGAEGVLDLNEPEEGQAELALTMWKRGGEAWGFPDLREAAKLELAVRFAAFPTLDESLALFILFARAAGRELPPSLEGLCRYAADVRQGLVLDRVAPERAVQALYLAIAQEHLLADPPERARFLLETSAFLTHVAGRLEAGERLLDDDLFAGEPRFERYLSLLLADRALYEEDLRRGARYLADLPPGESGTGARRKLPLLVLRRPVSRQFKVWARKDARAPGGGYPLMLVELGPGKLVLSADPSSRARVGWLAKGLGDAEREAGSSASWYDGKNHGRTIAASPKEGSRLSADAALRHLSRELRLRRIRSGRAAVALGAAALALAVGGAALALRAPAPPPHASPAASAEGTSPVAARTTSPATPSAAPSEPVVLAKAGPVGARGEPLPKASVAEIAKAHQDGSGRRRFALVAGVCGYEGDRKLAAPCDDARAVRERLVASYGYKREDILFFVDKPLPGEKTDGVPTAENLKLAVERFRARFGEVEASSFLFYYSGHGGYLKGAHKDYGVLQPAGFFTSHKNQPFAHRGWDMQTLLDDIKKGVPSKHIMIILDCCYSGWAGAKGEDDLDARVRSLWQESTEVVLTAGAQGQQSWEDDPKGKEWGGHGAMTAFFLQGLEVGPSGAALADANEDRVVTDEELAAYVKTRVPPAVRALKNATQTPQFFRVESGAAKEGQFLFVPAIAAKEEAGRGL